MSIFIDGTVFVFTLFLLAFYSWLSSPYLLGYMVVPILLIGVHVAGDAMQERHIGPDWIQNHLHNVGAVGTALNSVTLAILLIKQGSNQEIWRYRVADAIMWLTPRYWVAGTLAAIGMELYIITFSREQMIAAGYSGRLDYADVSAYLMGLAIVLLNHHIMRPRIQEWTLYRYRYKIPYRPVSFDAAAFRQLVCR